MKTIELAMQSILLKKNDIVVCGGMESMSNCPYYLSKDIRYSRPNQWKIKNSLMV